MPLSDFELHATAAEAHDDGISDVFFVEVGEPSLLKVTGFLARVWMTDRFWSLAFAYWPAPVRSVQSARALTACSLHLSLAQILASVHGRNILTTTCQLSIWS